MKEIRNIIQSYEQTDWAREQIALATVVNVEASAYRRIGARMLVKSTGVWIGGISGGCLEGDALKRAKIAILKKEPSIVVYDTMEEDAHQIGVGLGCNGRIEVLFMPIDSTDLLNPIEQLKLIQQKRVASVFYQVIGVDNANLLNMGLFATEEASADFAQQLQLSDTELMAQTELVRKRKKSKVFSFIAKNGEKKTILIEFLRPELRLILVGDNYDVNAFAGIAQELGWEINIIGLKRKLNAKIFQQAQRVYDYGEAQKLTIDEYSAIVLMSHDYKRDLQLLQFFLKQKPPYIGILGPKKRSEKMQKELGERSDLYALDKQSFFYSPIGLDIGAESPEEIALSVAAEIIAHFRARKGTFLRFRKGTIHDRD